MSLNIPDSTTFEPYVPFVHKCNEVTKWKASDCVALADCMGSTGFSFKKIRQCGRCVSSVARALGTQVDTRKRNPLSFNMGFCVGCVSWSNREVACREVTQEKLN